MKIDPEIDAAIEQAKPVKPVETMNLVASNAIELPITDKPLTGKSAAALLARLNQQYAVIKHGGKVVVLTFERQNERLVAEFLRFSDFRNLLMHRAVKVLTKKGAMLIPVGDWWLRQPERQQFDGLVFRPGDTRRVINNQFNLWRGWCCEPKAGDWSLMKAHIHDVMASCDPAKFEYILNWLAWCVQHPAQRAEVALVFNGP